MDRFWKYKLDQCLFWAATVFFHAFTRTALIREAGFFQFLLEIILRNALLASVIYLNLLILIPRFVQQKKYMAYVFLLLLCLAGYAFAKNTHDVYLQGYVLGEEARKYFFHNTFYNLSIGLFYVAFSIGMHLSKEWYFQKELIRKIEIEKLNSELDYLKSQINPHFLFNSINTIYFQIDKQNTGARDTLLTFSDMLRYQLYECNASEIPVEKEVAYLRNYVDLQRLRKEGSYKITFTAAEDVSNFSIVPLLLIPFVENAFKHISHFSNNENEIRINLTRTGRIFRMQVFNTKNTQPVETGGIGLKNVRRRLELLYNERHQFDIRETQGTFEIDLQLHIT